MMLQTSLHTHIVFYLSFMMLQTICAYIQCILLLSQPHEPADTYLGLMILEKCYVSVFLHPQLSCSSLYATNFVL